LPDHGNVVELGEVDEWRERFGVVRVTVVPIDEAPSGKDVRECLFPRDVERAVERCAIGEKEGVVVGLESREGYLGGEGAGGVVQSGGGRGWRGRRGGGFADLNVAEKSEAGVAGCLLELVLAVLCGETSGLVGRGRKREKAHFDLRMIRRHAKPRQSERAGQQLEQVDRRLVRPR
jgi:hypothetical protein